MHYPQPTARTSTMFQPVMNVHHRPDSPKHVKCVPSQVPRAERRTLGISIKLPPVRLPNNNLMLHNNYGNDDVANYVLFDGCDEWEGMLYKIRNVQTMIIVGCDYQIYNFDCPPKI